MTDLLVMMDPKDRRKRPENVYWVDDPNDEVLANANTVLSLSRVSEMFGVSRTRLRLFEFLGLIKRRYRAGTERVYGWADCERIVFIIKAQRAGLGLCEIAPVIRATNSNLLVSERRAGLAKCLALIDRLQESRRCLDQAHGELQHICALLTSELDSASGSDAS